MQASLQPLCTWSQDHIFAGGAQNIVLLVEWRGAASLETESRTHKVAACDIELRIWLEPHMQLTGLHGCRKWYGGDRSLLLPLGKIYAGQRKDVALEFSIQSAPVGIHEAVWLQWAYKQPSSQRMRELPMQKCSLQSVRHTGFLQESCCFYVEKHLELLKIEEVYESAELLRSQGKSGEAQVIIRRQADKLLLLAVRSGDAQLLKEAESMYRMIEAEVFPLYKSYTNLSYHDCAVK
ncbi:hypothetical protein [Paenibacillus sp. sgz500958]|uniref:hypothetical protein n=1 Tax=Paenibacillus sp. sgz500958 TaxID=3242475 RepID=UPI0036D42D2A